MTNVQWCHKFWEDFSDDDKRKLAIHLKELDKPDEYIKYLGTYCKAPVNKLMIYMKGKL